MAVATAGTTLKPSLPEAVTLFEQGDLLPVYRTLLADLETPVSVFWKLLQTGTHAFMLESVEGGEQVGRYSFLGVNPKGVVTAKHGQVTLTRGGETITRPLRPGEDPLHAVEAEFGQVRPIKLDGLPRFVGGAVGCLAYDVVRYFERLPDSAQDDLDFPDVAFLLIDTLVIFDHAKHQVIVLANAHHTGDTKAAYADAAARVEALVDVLTGPLPPLDDEPRPPTSEDAIVGSNVEQAAFEANVLAAKEHIAAGDAFQIVLSQRFSRRTSASPFTIYRALRGSNPSPYMFYLKFGDDFTLIGASPEMMVRLEDGVATTRPIAGSRPRGRTDAEDQALADELISDPKERAEHIMLVDLGRNDLGRVCDYGTVQVSRLMYIERYSQIMHIVSNVQGKLRAGMNAFDLLRATFPAGTLSGAPKVRAMEIIEELEGTRRGPYGGAVGYFSFDGSMDTCITIRAALVRGNLLTVQAGAGLVADSVPANEFQESINKARAMILAVQRAEQGLR